MNSSKKPIYSEISMRTVPCVTIRWPGTLKEFLLEQGRRRKIPAKTYYIDPKEQ